MMTDRAHTIEDHAPQRRYSSFLLRCWHVGSQLRIKVEHIQSGESTQVNTYEAALTWLSEHCTRTATDQPASSSQVRLADGEPH